MNINVIVMSSSQCHCDVVATPDRWQQIKKQRREYHWPLERRPRHCSGRNINAGTIGLSPDKMAVGRSGTCLV